MPSSPTGNGPAPTSYAWRSCARWRARRCCRPGSRSAKTARSSPTSRCSCPNIRCGSDLGTNSPSHSTAAGDRRTPCAGSPPFEPSCATSWVSTSQRQCGDSRSRILESDPALLDLARASVRPSVAASWQPRSRRSWGAAPTSPASSATSTSTASSRLVGAGGVGKTRLALRVAADLCDDHLGEVYVVELAPVHDPLSTVASVATAVDVHQRQYLSVEETLVEYLRGPQRAARARQLRTPSPRGGPSGRPHARRLPGPHRARHESGGARASGRTRPPGRAARRGDRFDADRRTGEGPCDPDVRRARRGVESGVRARCRQRRIRSPRSSDASTGFPLAIELAAARSSAISPAALAERLRERFDLLDHAQAGRYGTASDAHRARGLVVQPVERRRADPVRSGVGVRRPVQPRRRRDDLHRRITRRLVRGTCARRPRRQVDGPVCRRCGERIPRARAAAPVRRGGAPRIRTGRGRRPPRDLVPRPRRAIVRVDGGPRRARSVGPTRPRVRQPPRRLLAPGRTARRRTVRAGSWRHCGSTRSGRCAPRSSRGPTR